MTRLRAILHRLRTFACIDGDPEPRTCTSSWCPLDRLAMCFELQHEILEVRWRASDGGGVWSCSCGELGSGVGYPDEVAVAREADAHADSRREVPPPALAVTENASATMTPVTQTLFYEPDASPDKQRGNCFTAVTASLMHLPIEEVPNFVQDHVNSDGEKDWWHTWWTFVHDRGFHIALLRDELQPDSAFPLPEPGEPYTVSGVSPRDPLVHHVVIYVDGVMVHDPHPDRTGLAVVSTEGYRWTIRPGTPPA